MSDIDPVSLYEIQECIGRGNFGDVYKAVEKTTRAVVAVKVVNFDDSEDEVHIILQEIKFLSLLRSPYMTRYFNSFMRDNSLWMIMEYCGGGSCADYLRAHKFFCEEAIALILRDILQGLAYLHSHLKIHRDIKAANILLTETGQVKLADFGVSGQLTCTKARNDTFVGTPFWMAPEIIVRNKGYNEKIDIWSTGITLIELAQGNPPNHRADPMKHLFRIPEIDPPVLSGKYSRNLKNVVSRCLQKDPNQRPSANALLKHDFVRCTRKKATLMSVLNNVELKVITRKPKKALKLDQTPTKTVPWDFTPFNERDEIWNEENKENLVAPSTPINQEGLGEPTTPDRCPLGSRKAGKRYKQQAPIVKDSIDYTNAVIGYAFNRVLERSKSYETKFKAVRMRDRFIEFDQSTPGFCEALVEEILLRAEELK